MVIQSNIERDSIFSALITPMYENEEINYQALRSLVDAQLGIGAEGFYCCGSSGEALLLTIEERKKVLETVIDQVNGRAPVIAHVGTIRTNDVINLAKHAKSIGVNAVSMIPPYYYKFSFGEIFSYYKDVINAVPNLQVIIYNIPQFTGIEFDKNNARELLKISEVMGIKFTSTNLFGMERFIDAFPQKMIFNGFDEQYLAAISMGSSGTIGTTVNLFAPLFVQVREYFQQGDFSSAYKVQQAINNKIELMLKTNIFAAVKFGWTLRGIDCGNCRAPIKKLSMEEKTMLEELCFD